MTFRIEGNDCLPSVSGGYLVITIDGEEIATVGVPSPAFEDRYRDSLVENDDEFTDEEGNTYSISVYSSNVGVEWVVTVDSEDTDSIKDRLHVEYQANEY
ncbi:hypothetical protein SNR26_20700 [Pectobacterium brasiliense]|uniref:hypothetical protein n=1 Tax=Pectobacterium brasiliense TaxID=180957 RepID=UPI002A808CF1|nr:hypothetical protein [Pectobacterium brasiliense]MDY4370126.1 hypothetical protein [Pectobacterium brasiliense]MDY7059658.1 hypothetical protein [Pectobacterium brasiliense]